MPDLFHNLTIDSDARSVYDAFSDPEKLDNWWTKEASGLAEENEIYRMYFGGPYDWRFRVTRAERPENFEWQVVRADSDWNGTRVGIRLKEKGNGTSLSFYHTGWPETNDHFKHSNFCWALLLKGLQDYIEKGVIIPFDQRA